MLNNTLRFLLLSGIAVFALFWAATVWSYRPVAPLLQTVVAATDIPAGAERTGRVSEEILNDNWNISKAVQLSDIPLSLRQAFLVSQDPQFFDHSGVDWSERLSAILQNIRSGRHGHSSSTITEQVVRMIDPRPRTVWSKWIEGLEAASLERTTNKSDIFEFYLNQIPYADNRRGVVQGARYYFNKDLKSLSPKENLALVLLARPPSSMDFDHHPEMLEGPVMVLADKMREQGVLPDRRYQQIKTGALKFSHREACTPAVIKRGRCQVKEDGVKPRKESSGQSGHGRKSGVRISWPPEGLVIKAGPTADNSPRTVEFKVLGTKPLEQVQWILDGKPVSDPTAATQYTWTVVPGDHSLTAKVFKEDHTPVTSSPIHFHAE